MFGRRANTASECIIIKIILLSGQCLTRRPYGGCRALFEQFCVRLKFSRHNQSTVVFNGTVNLACATRSVVGYSASKFIQIKVRLSIARPQSRVPVANSSDCATSLVFGTRARIFFLQNFANLPNSLHVLLSDATQFAP